MTTPDERFDAMAAAFDHVGAQLRKVLESYLGSPATQDMTERMLVEAQRVLNGLPRQPPLQLGEIVVDGDKVSFTLKPPLPPDDIHPPFTNGADVHGVVHRLGTSMWSGLVVRWCDHGKADNGWDWDDNQAITCVRCTSKELRRASMARP